MSAVPPQPASLFDALLAARRKHGGRREIVEDQERRPLTYTGLVRAAFALGRRIVASTAPGERVGVLLPSSMGAVVAFFALQAFGRTPVMLNFSAGAANLLAACRQARVRRVLTSRRFVEQAGLEVVVEALSAVTTIALLEDVRAALSWRDKLYALLAGALPRLFRRRVAPADIGVILFTSGSFGAPKGVVLTQANLVANVAQVDEHVQFDRDWLMFNPLPVFHSFGLTAGLLFPILTGMKSFQYPSPLHAKKITTLLGALKDVVLLTTDTFMNQYLRAAAPGDLRGLRYAIFGAERLRAETRRAVTAAAGADVVLEGYGVTETSPVLSVNPPGRARPGTAGPLVPRIEARLEPVEGIAAGGRLVVRGPNVMAGYLAADGEPVPPKDGWHDTGDIVVFDEAGYVTILGRAARFAKIGGEMVSLLAAEELAASLWPDARHAVLAVADERKGERLVLVTTAEQADAPALVAHARNAGAHDLMVPRRIVRLAEMPLLGSGKTDYVALQALLAAEAGELQT